jgi:hypothetical protein
MSNSPVVDSIKSNTINKTISKEEEKIIDEKLEDFQFFSKEIQNTYNILWKIKNELFYYFTGNKRIDDYQMIFWNGVTRGEIGNPDPKGYKYIYVKDRQVSTLNEAYQQKLELNELVNRIQDEVVANRINSPQEKFEETLEENFDAIKKCVNKKLSEEFVFLERKDKDNDVFIEVFIELYDVEKNKEHLVENFHDNFCKNDTKPQGGARNKSKKQVKKSKKVQKIKKSKKSKKIKKSKKSKKSKKTKKNKLKKKEQKV